MMRIHEGQEDTKIVLAAMTERDESEMIAVDRHIPADVIEMSDDARPIYTQP